MQIDISWIFSHPDAVSNTLVYGRIDNTATPTYYTITGITTSPYNITVDNGQYSISGTPVYADGRTCSPTIQTTPACPLIIGLNAVKTGTNLVITYTTATDIPQVRVKVNYPNGGSYVQNYTNGNSIVIPLPTGVYGDYTIYMQSVCDPDTGFYSPLTAPVTVTVSEDVPTNNAVTVRMLNATSYWNNKTDACTAIGTYGAGFSISTFYVKSSDYSGFLTGTPVTAYSDAACTTILKDITLPAFSTKERVVFITQAQPVIWQTDLNQNVSVTLQSC